MKSNYVAFIFLLLISCLGQRQNEQESGYELNIEFENIDGLEKGSPVLYQGMKVGKVKNLEISEDQNRIIVKISIDTLKIPVGSDFTIFSANMLGTRAINVELSDKKEFLKDNAVIIGKNQQSLGVRVDQEINEVKNFIADRIEVIENNDSVLILKLDKSGMDTVFLHYFLKTFKK